MARSIKRIRTVPSLFARVTVDLVIVQQVAFGCGLNWNEPQSHFQGVSFQGYVFHVENLGEIDLGQGLKLPLRAHLSL